MDEEEIEHSHYKNEDQPLDLKELGGTSKRKRKVDESGAPKRAKTAYLIFCDKYVSQAFEHESRPLVVMPKTIIFESLGTGPTS